METTERSDQDPKRVQKFFPDPGETKQEFKEECNINTLMDRLAKTGAIGHVNQGTPNYGDFSTVVDFHSSLLRVKEAQRGFMALPAKVRSRFGNDPGAMLEFLEDEDNRPEAEKLGLVPGTVPIPKPKDDQVEAPKPKEGEEPPGIQGGE